MSCEFATLDAAYVLGSLAPAERAEYESHLRTCDECAQAVRELAGMPGLLARVPADVLEEPVLAHPVPDTLLPGLVAAAQKQQRRRTIRTALLAAAAVAIIAGGSAVVATSLGEGDEGRDAAEPPVVVETTAPPEQMTSVGYGESTGWVSLTPLAWGGTRVDLSCEYRSSYGGDHAYMYTLVIRTTDGLEDQVASFSARSGDEVQADGDTSHALEEIAAVEVRTSDGEAILRLTP
jgi:hypothetical protein